MKTGIHPKYEMTKFTCACGNTFEEKSTRTNVRIDLCNVCHPFYTGEQRIVDTAGQVERFTKKMERAATNDGAVSKRQQRINLRATQLADEKRRQEEAAAAARAAQKERARAAAENRAALAAQQAEAQESAEASADAVETEAAAVDSEAVSVTEE
jgi:large subunit ribosomal protein L31